MQRGVITINEMGAVTIPAAPVWMTKFEIADLFGVFAYDIRKAITADLQERRIAGRRNDEVYPSRRECKL